MAGPLESNQTHHGFQLMSSSRKPTFARDNTAAKSDISVPFDQATIRKSEKWIGLGVQLSISGLIFQTSLINLQDEHE